MVAVRNMFVADTDEAAASILLPRLEWTGDLAVYLRSPVSALAGSGGIRGYEHYVRDPFIDPELVQRRGQEAVGAMGSPDTVTAAIRDLQSKHVNQFLGFMDTGSLSYAEMEPSLRLFAEQVMPNFK